MKSGSPQSPIKRAAGAVSTSQREAGSRGQPISVRGRPLASADPQRPPEASEAAPALSPEARPPLHLPLAGPDAVVTRTRDRGGPESPPSNRYAGDWSVCGRDFLSGGRDFLPGPEDEGDRETDSEDDDVDDIEAPFIPHLNLSDFDALILDLERELAKQINVCL